MTTMVDSKENVRVGQDKVSEKVDRKNKQVQTQRCMAAVKSEKDKKIRVCGPVWCVCGPVPAQSRGGKEIQVVRGFASVLKVLEDTDTCSEWVKCQGTG